MKLTNPAPGFRYSQPFKPGVHNGLDIACPTGTPLKACSDGVVRFAGRLSSSPGSGICLGVDADDGHTFWSFSHCQEVRVSAGARVSEGDVIAISNNTGDTTGPHLHFVVSVDHDEVDPEPFIAETSAAGLAVKGGLAFFIGRQLWKAWRKRHPK